MGFTLLISGVALWTVVHLFKRLAPGPRARMGEKGAGLVTLLLVVAIVLMVLGYQRAGFIALYWPQSWGLHANNLLVLIGFYVFGIGMAKGALSQKIRHPMLSGTVLWAAGHLLVRGDLASVILFAGLAFWALLAMTLINGQDRAWVPPKPKGGIMRDLVAVPIVLVTYAVVGWVHGWLGHWPFGAG